MPESLSDSVCKALQLMKASVPTLPQQLKEKPRLLLNNLKISNFLWHHALLLVALQKISLLIMVVQAIRELVQLSFLNLELEMENILK